VGRVVVHPHEDLGATARHQGDGLVDQPAGAVLLLRRDGILQVQHDGVGPPEVRLLHEPRDVDRQDERRSSDKKSH
jgi:hypothetical protein